MQTIKTIKLEVRELGKGWAMIDYLDAERLDSLIIENNIQEYVIYEINEVTLELKHVKTLFKGVKHVAVSDRCIGTSKHDIDNTELFTKETVSDNGYADELKENKIKSDIEKINYEKTSYSILLGNGEGISVIIHRSINNTWCATLESSGKCISSNHRTRISAYEKTKDIIEKVGTQYFKNK